MRASQTNGEAPLHGKNPVGTVIRINRRWIVHGGLSDSSAAYIGELSQSDPARLRRSCRLAMDLVHARPAQADPKPWFYAGLFALATPAEARRFLQQHPLTRMVWESLHHAPGQRDAPESLRNLSQDIASMIREISQVAITPHS